MTKEHICIAVAKLDGEPLIKYTKVSVSGSAGRKTTRNKVDVKFKPYLTSRDAIIPVILKQPYAIQVAVVAQFKKASQSSLGCALDILKAEADQLCKYLLIAEGLWKE